jgi:hypothetical protein
MIKIILIILIILILLILCIYRKDTFTNDSNDPDKPFVYAFSNRFIDDINLIQ